MVIVNKRKILIMLNLIIITTILASLIVYYNSNKTSQNLIPIVALPVSNKTVVIDAGHRSEKMVVQLVAMESLKQKLI